MTQRERGRVNVNESTSDTNTFIGQRQLRRQIQEQLEQFEEWNEQHDWLAFHNHHYDWWMFPSRYFPSILSSKIST
jgi:hypothetical protein